MTGYSDKTLQKHIKDKVDFEYFFRHAKVNPNALAVMREVGIDLCAHRSKSVDEIPKERIGTVITLCAEEVCPVFPGAVTRLHWPFEDPAAASGTPEEVSDAFRRVRDRIRGAVERFFCG